MFQTSSNLRRRTSPGSKGAHLPEGECQFILLHPELRGQRCACVGFFLSNSTSESTCECGHQPCYHLDQREERAERKEVENLKEKVRLLEREFGREKQDVGADLAYKFDQLEDTLERHTSMMEREIKGAYQEVRGLWQTFRNMQSDMQNWAKHYDDQIEALIDANHSCSRDIANFEKRLIDFDDASMKMEDRIESLERCCPEAISCQRNVSASPEMDEEDEVEQAEKDLSGQEGKISQRQDNAPIAYFMDEKHSRLERRQSKGFPDVDRVDDSISKSWTVHVSLLPKASTPMPFEKDTNAYKRCLSRGLHRMLAIPGHDSESFNQAISDAFHFFLLGRPWMPLDAKLCDAPINGGALIGLPMLRSLPKHEIDAGNYTYQWLSQRCATRAPNGKIADLYIAMIHESLTWNEIGKAPVFIKGLEGCWNYDSVLDRQGEDLTSNEGTSAGDTIMTKVVRNKRQSRFLSSQSRVDSTEGDMLAKRARSTVTESVGRLRSMSGTVS